MEWKSSVVNDQGLIKIPKRWLHLHYYEALNLLFRFENSLRVFVYAILKNEYLEKWRDCNLIMPGGEQITIKKLAARRTTQADNFGYLGYDIKAALMHLTSGELVELITSEAYWEKFKPYFRGNKEIIKNKLLEIGSIRNSLAHFRPIKSEDIELIKQNSRHTLIGVEGCLYNMIDHSVRIPTNTSSDWYRSISALGTEQIKTTPYYSEDEQWININLIFDTQIIGKKKIVENYYSFHLTKINSPHILINYKEITKYLTCLSELTRPPMITNDWDVEIKKELNFVFRKDIFIENYVKIADEFKNVLTKISEECDLLRQDHLARGTLIETIEGSSWWTQREEQPGKWYHTYDKLAEKYSPDHPDEYWGQYQFTADVIAGTRRYPWMPADISEIEGFADY